MGQKDQDGYHAEKCHFFVNVRAYIYQFKNRLNQKQNHVVHYFVYKSHYFETKKGWVH